MKGRKRHGGRRTNRSTVAREVRLGGPGGSLVRFWRAKLLAEGQRVGRREMWRRMAAMWATCSPAERRRALATRRRGTQVAAVAPRHHSKRRRSTVGP